MKIYKIILILLFFIMFGCDNGIFSFDPFLSEKKNVVVVSNVPEVLTVQPKVIDLTKPLEVVGKTSSLCMVLESGVKSDGESQYKKLVGDITAIAKMESTNGKTHDLSFLGRSWSRKGVILDKDELSVCLSECEDKKIPTGSEIRKITLKTSAPLQIKGIFWKSTNAFDKMYDN